MSSTAIAVPRPASLAALVGPVVHPGAFDLTQGMNLVRLAAGLFYVPHVMFKLNGIAGALAFFGKAGLNPPEVFLGLALLTEALCAIGLTFGLFTRWIGLMSAGCMMVAAYAVIATKGVGWYWNLGGLEYLAFWGIASLAVSIDAWRAPR